MNIPIDLLLAIHFKVLVTCREALRLQEVCSCEWAGMGICVDVILINIYQVFKLLGLSTPEHVEHILVPLINGL